MAISTVPKKLKVKPMWEQIVAVDETGKEYGVVDNAIEVELNGPIIDGVAKFTGTATVTQRWVPELQEGQ